MSETLEELLNRVQPKEEAVAPTTEEKKEVEVVEEVVETNEVVEDTKTEEVIETEPEKKSFSELLKTVPTEVKVEEKKVEVPDEILAELQDYKEKLSIYQNDPLHKAVAMGASRDELLAIIAEINGKDYSKSSYKDLIASEIQSLSGMEGEDLAEQVELALAEYNELPKWKQIAAEKEMQAKFQAKSKKGDSPTLKAIEEAYSLKVAAMPTPEREQEVLKTRVAKETGSIKAVGTTLIGSVLEGVEFTQEQLNEIIEKDYDPFDADKKYLNKDGELENVAEFINDKFILKNFYTMVANAKKQGALEANKGTAATRVVKKTTVVSEKQTENEKTLVGLGLGHVVESPKSIRWKE